MHLLLLDNKWRYVPFATLLVPSRLVLNFVHLLVRHQTASDLAQEIYFLGLLTDRLQQVFVVFGIFFVDVFQFVVCVLEFLPQLFDDFTAVFHLFLQRVVKVLLLQQLLFLLLLLM